MEYTDASFAITFQIVQRYIKRSLEIHLPHTENRGKKFVQMRSIQKLAHIVLKYARLFWLTLIILPLVQLFWNYALTPAKDFPSLFSKSILALLFLPGLNLTLTLCIVGLLLLLNASAWILLRMEKKQNHKKRNAPIRAETPAMQWKGSDAFILKVLWSPNGRYLASAGSEGVIEVWDGRTFSLLKQLAPNNEPVDWLRSLAWSQDSRFLIAGGEGGDSRTWNMVTGTVHSLLHHSANAVLALGWSLQGVMVVTEEGWSACFSPITGTWQELSTSGSAVQVAAWSWQGELLARASHNGEIIIQQEGVSRNLTSYDSDIQQARVLSWNTIDTCLAIGYNDGSVQIWEVNQGTKLVEWSTGQLELQALCWTTKGHSLISADEGGGLKIWHITGQLQYEFDTHIGCITALASSPDNQFLCSAHEKGILAVWRISQYCH